MTFMEIRDVMKACNSLMIDITMSRFGNVAAEFINASEKDRHEKTKSELLTVADSVINDATLIKEAILKLKATAPMAAADGSKAE